ncbi:DUF2982 domain-containing protein [Vibrio sp. RC27]
MQTRQFANLQIGLTPRWRVLIFYLYLAIALIAAVQVDKFSNAIAILMLFSGIALIAWFIIQKLLVKYTMTPSHFQQHFFKGGWVVKWNNISSIEMCYIDQQGYSHPLPWIGIRLKQPDPYLDSICPRIISDQLLEQRALLYSGLKQQGMRSKFEDYMLDDSPYTSPNGKMYKGLLAMMANRMHYQRQAIGFDIFISIHDLGCDADEFIGLARRYIAAAEPD